MKKKFVYFYWSLLLLSLSISPAKAANMIGRLGLGMSNQLATGVPAISMKIQRSPTYAMGALVGVRYANNSNSYGGGLRLYRLIFDEPQLNFYVATTMGFGSKEVDGQNQSGLQFDGALGTEFHFTGLESIGFSFEFGVGINNIGPSMVVQTLGQNFMVASAHFYF